MSSVKISELAPITVINANTANTLLMGVDIPTGVTGKFTAHTLAQGLYSNEVLNVGTNQQNLPNTIAQFALGGQSYIQTNLVNTNDGGSADIVVTANTGTDSTYFIDVGYVNKDYQPGSEYNNIGTAVNRLDGYIYVQGSTSNTWGGNLIVGSTSTGKEVRFIAGGGSTENVVARMNATSIILNQSLVFADGTTQNTAAGLTAGTYANGAFVQANTAFTKANNALANTTGTFAGSLTITGAVTANSSNIGNLTISNSSIYSTATTVDMIIGQSIATANLVINRTTNITKDINITGNLVTNGTLIDFNNTTFDPNTAFVQITGSNTAYPASNTNYMLQITGKANSVTRLVLDSFGATTYPVLVGRMSRGSSSSPVAIANNDIMMRIVGNGYTGTQFPSSSPTKIDFIASENFTDAARGTRIEFYNTPIGSNTIQRIASFNADSVTFAGHVEPQKGFIYTPTIYPGAQTAITIDFANNSLVRAQTSTGLVVTLSNLLAGKEVVAWITNTSGFSQTFTHGVSALNSSVNATTYSIPSTSTIMVRYMCIDATTQNTFVAITHA